MPRGSKNRSARYCANSRLQSNEAWFDYVQRFFAAKSSGLTTAERGQTRGPLLRWRELQSQRSQLAASVLAGLAVASATMHHSGNERTATQPSSLHAQRD